MLVRQLNLLSTAIVLLQLVPGMAERTRPVEADGPVLLDRDKRINE